jgi:hypothetical protein
VPIEACEGREVQLIATRVIESYIHICVRVCVCVCVCQCVCVCVCVCLCVYTVGEFHIITYAVCEAINFCRFLALGSWVSDLAAARRVPRCGAAMFESSNITNKC